MLPDVLKDSSARTTGCEFLGQWDAPLDFPAAKFI